MAIANALANPELYQKDDSFIYDFEDKRIKADPGVEKVIEHWQDYIIAAKKNEQKVKVEKHLINFLNTVEKKAQDFLYKFK